MKTVRIYPQRYKLNDQKTGKNENHIFPAKPHIMITSTYQPIEGLPNNILKEHSSLTPYYLSVRVIIQDITKPHQEQDDYRFADLTSNFLVFISQFDNQPGQELQHEPNFETTTLAHLFRLSINNTMQFVFSYLKDDQVQTRMSLQHLQETANELSTKEASYPQLLPNAFVIHNHEHSFF